MLDDQLTQRIAARDTEALAEFIEAKRSQLTAIIERRLGDALQMKIEPDDILQEVSGAAIRGLSEVDLVGGDPFGWLCQLAERKIVDAHRRYFAAKKRDARREMPLGRPTENSEEAALVDLLVSSITSPSAAFSRGQRESKLLAALEELPDESRTAIRWRYIDGLPTKQIAAQLNKTDGAVRVMLTRALKKLEELLGPDAAPRRS